MIRNVNLVLFKIVNQRLTLPAVGLAHDLYRITVRGYDGLRKDCNTKHTFEHGVRNGMPPSSPPYLLGERLMGPRRSHHLVHQLVCVWTAQHFCLWTAAWRAMRGHSVTSVCLRARWV